jgi:hypothetical protein
LPCSLAHRLTPRIGDDVDEDSEASSKLPIPKIKNRHSSGKRRSVEYNSDETSSVDKKMPASKLPKTATEDRQRKSGDHDDETFSSEKKISVSKQPQITGEDRHSKKTSGDQNDDETPSVAKKMPAARFKKAPQAPRRFKSAFIFFSSEKHRQIREQMGEKGVTEKVITIMIHSGAPSQYYHMISVHKSPLSDNQYREAGIGGMERNASTGKRKVGDLGPERQGPI